MRLVVRVDPKRWRRLFSFIGSACVHGAVLVWITFGPPLPAKRPGLYEQAIKPAHIIWYSLKLPNVSPAETTEDHRSPRASRHAPRQLVAGKRDTARPPQLIWTPAPSLEKPRLIPSPNLIAMARPVQPPRAFQPPPAASKLAQPALPSAPDLTVAAENRSRLASVLPPLTPARKTFIPPVEAVHSPQAVNLPVAPQMAEKAPTQPVLPDLAMAKPVRQFTPPPQRKAPAPAAPQLTDAPVVAQSQASLVIASLLPQHATEIPRPKASQDAGFSAGPKLRHEGGHDPASNELAVPGLLARGAPGEARPALLARLEAPTSLENLRGAAGSVRIGTAARQTDGRSALRITAAPDPRFAGRDVYSFTVQMPNVTSYSGSWLVWFADRSPGPDPLELLPPLPLRKVDPKYVASAAADRVEGKVRLSAIIGADGRVVSVEVIRPLDDRLDRSAQEALQKWEFEPATRNGMPVAVDAIFDIPFHLAPRTAGR